MLPRRKNQVTGVSYLQGDAGPLTRSHPGQGWDGPAGGGRILKCKTRLEAGACVETAAFTRSVSPTAEEVRQAVLQEKQKQEESDLPLFLFFSGRR